MLRRLSPALCVAAVLAGCSDKPSPPSPRPTVHALAGDLVEIDGQAIHLANVDAPRSGSAARCWAEAALAQQATRQLGQVADLYARFAVQKLGTDDHGRTLALVAGDGHDLGEALIGQGLAVEATGGGWDWCAHANARDDRALWLGVVPPDQVAARSANAVITRARSALGLPPR